MPVIKTSQNKIYYEEYGSGLPIVFLHPPGMGRKVFKYQENLAGGFRVIFPDLSGHGDSSAVESHVTIEKYADEVLALIDGLKLGKIAVVGYSSGGSIAQEFALRYPDRTVALILSGGFAEVESGTLKYEHILGMYFVKHAPKILAKVIATAHTFDKNFRQELIDHMLKADRRTWFQFYHESLHYSCLGRLGNLKIPLLLVYGARDFINQHIRAYERTVPGYKAVFINQVSHQVPVKKHQQFNEEIKKFLEGLQIIPE